MNRLVNLRADPHVVSIGQESLDAMNTIAQARQNRQANPSRFEPRTHAQDLFRLSQTQRRLAHCAKREALKWAGEGNRKNYLDCRKESDRLWREAKAHMLMARHYFERARA